MSDRLCYVVKGFDGESDVLIPGCMGAAAYQHESLSECFCREIEQETKADAERHLCDALDRARRQLGLRRVKTVVQAQLGLALWRGDKLSEPAQGDRA